MKCIVIDENGLYLTARKATGNMYQSRVTWSEDISQSKIFQTAGAARNSANASSHSVPYDVCEIVFTVGQIIDPK